jgi:hypothetical protein
MLCDMAERAYLNMSWTDEVNMSYPDGWSCQRVAIGKWRETPTLVLVAETYSLLLLGPKSVFGHFPSVQIDHEPEYLDFRWEPSEPGTSGESWYLDDSDQLQEGVGWERPGLVAGHALIRFSYAVGCSYESDLMVEKLGNFYPENLGVWATESSLTVNINRDTDNGPQSRLYQELIVEASKECKTSKDFLEIYESFVDLFGWYGAAITDAHVVGLKICSRTADKILGICSCERCALNQDELPF